MNARRRGVMALVVVGCLGIAAPAWGGTYLNRAGLLVGEAAREAEVLRKRLHDKELARVVHKLAEARVEAASTMHVPKEVAVAHPHLLLVLENYERAADAAVDGRGERFLVHLARAREEESTLRGVLKQLGWKLPEL